MDVLDRKKIVEDRVISQWGESKNLIELSQAIALDSSCVEVVLFDLLTKRIPPSNALANDALERLAEVFGVNLSDFDRSDPERLRMEVFSSVAKYFCDSTAKKIVSLCIGVFSLDVARVIDIYPAGFFVEASGDSPIDSEVLSLTISLMKAAGVSFEGLFISATPPFSFAEYTGPDETRGFLDDDNPTTTGGFLSDIF